MKNNDDWKGDVLELNFFDIKEANILRTKVYQLVNETHPVEIQDTEHGVTEFRVRSTSKSRRMSAFYYIGVLVERHIISKRETK